MRVVNRLLPVLVGVLSFGGCAQPRMQIAPVVPPCRAASAGGENVRWVAPDDAVTRRLLSSWCDTVGPAGFHRRTGPAHSGATVVVTWNLHGGAGDVRTLLAQVREDERAAGRPDPNIILLLQEAIRIGAAPSRVPEGSSIPRRIASPRAVVADILELARLEDLNAVYIPSMRNGREGSNGRQGVPEDRGNAILATMPISDVAAIELPFAAQRRVAISARIGDPSMALRVVSVHLDTFGGHGRQASALLDALALLDTGGRLLIAGDFNSSMRRGAVIRSSGLEVHRVTCPGVTHRFFQLDHVLTRNVEAVSDCVRLPRFGSDHTPLRFTLSFPNQTDAAAPFRSTAPARRPSRK
jgi:endonuclease/exonuclease/phosphatase family metal-dependent hydrolase